MKTVSIELAQELIDYAPTAETVAMGFGESQLHGAVAAYNMLARNGIAYLADEVGMGKTYVALGVFGLLRHLHPRSRVMIIAPRENIQRKWVKELGNFVRKNWRVEDNRVRNLRGNPARKPRVVAGFDDLARACQRNDSSDLFLRMTSFSIGTNRAEDRDRLRQRVRPYLPWLKGSMRANDPFAFRDQYGRALNALLPPIDLLIVDEAHNLKHGIHPKVSNRNRVLGLALGHPAGADAECDWYGRRARRVLMLSATPFEYDYRDLWNQLDVLGCGDGAVVDAQGNDPLSLQRLRDSADDDERRSIARRFLIRRVQYLKIAGREHSKNMYRREWRRGGYEHHDEPMVITDTKQKLVVGLMQKKVAEVLGDRRFQNSFQIGMLSSFESFIESMERRQQKQRAEDALIEPPEGDADGDDEPPIFDGHQEATRVEKRGADTHSLDTVVRSHREVFGRGLPHPKLDATADALAETFFSGEKSLVFVRRVATVGELRDKLNRVFDQWILRRMTMALPSQLTPRLQDLFARYDRQRRDPEDESGEDSSHPRVGQVEEDLVTPLDTDSGGKDTFFAWFFRGDGPSGVLSGAAFQKNRLSAMSSAHALLFEDDYISWLLDWPEDPIAGLMSQLGMSREGLEIQLRAIAFGHFRERTRQKEGYPRFYVYEGYQVAALGLLMEAGGELGHKAAQVLQLRYNHRWAPVARVPPGFPDAAEVLGTKTFFTELRRRPALCESLWPASKAPALADTFREQEQRRELISAMARLGASFIDLYVLAIGRLGAFDLGQREAGERPAEQLATDFLDLLERQRDGHEFGAFHELSSAARTFHLLEAVNFPEIHDAPISSLPEIFGRHLQQQVPVGGMHGGINKRLVQQFRMPGFPLVLITTDVLQEGEDLHTFCRRVVHYGFSWTPSAIEQRVGRIDRIGSLAHRHLDGRAAEPKPDKLIQVYMPHLQDTIEVLQARRVLLRLDRFLRMVHDDVPIQRRSDSRIDIASEILEKLTYPPPIEGLLTSAFPVTEPWREGELGPTSIHRPNIGALERHLEELWHSFIAEYLILVTPTGSRRCYAGTAHLRNTTMLRRKDTVQNSDRRQPFELELRSQIVGGATLVRCTSPVGPLDIEDDEKVDRLYDLQRELGIVKVCVEPTKCSHDVRISGERFFHIETTQSNELERLIVDTVTAADRLEDALLASDEAAEPWHDARRRHGNEADY